MSQSNEPAIGIQYELRQLATATIELAGKIDYLNEVVTTGFSELKQITQQQADTARLQAESVSRLVRLLERSDGN